MGIRGAKIGLSLAKRDGRDYRDISSLCTFVLEGKEYDLVGEVVSIPMTPEQMLEDQSLALERMHRAVKWAERDGEKLVAVGLGSLCAIVANRGRALQERLSIPVTTGNAATAWTIVRNCLSVNPQKKEMAVIGAGSPVGQIVVPYLLEQGIAVRADSKKLRKHVGVQIFSSAEECVREQELIVGCGPTGPMVQTESIRRNATILDVALPHSISDARSDITVYLAERMSMPDNWQRGIWGIVYHLVSGYGYNTILACLVEPLIIAHSQRTKAFAQGRRLEMEDVLAFGDGASQLGFHPVLSQ